MLIGRYQLADLIGSGTLGDVYRAVDTATGQPAAIKLMRLPDLHADGASSDTSAISAALSDTRRLFQAEAAAAQRLRHPGIVQVIDAGITAGRAWLAMELLSGHTLQQHTTADALLPWPQALNVAQRLAQALDCAHRQGVLHRDVKPANVMVDLPHDRVTLMDFGVARLADAERTRTGLMLGTPAYMAPELLAGAPASAASDLYALGAVLFELLAGRRPHDAKSMGALLRQVAREPAPTLATLRHDVPPELSVLVAQLLAKSPADRPADASALAAVLAAVQPPPVPPVAPTEPPRGSQLST